MPTPVVVTRIQNRRGTQTQFNGPSGIYPPGYTGIGGFGSIPGYNIVNYPSVLVPGELALCTDTRRLFMGNINGEYIELGMSAGSDITLVPAVRQLVPSPTFIPTGIEYPTTPFRKILYDLTDSTNANWDYVGTNFSRNGQLEITAVTNFVPAPPVPPFPPITPVTLNDTGTEINKVLPNNITFKAQYKDISAILIEIVYKHNFSGPLTFSSSSVRWLPF